MINMKTLNYSEIARQIGLSSESFRKKRLKINYNKFNLAQLTAIEFVLSTDVDSFLTELKSKT